ncbi:MAG: hypothetical protein IKI11_07320 [Neisseriaceae bacterium]|nr:hypothetical protein [Neisseriaceae bacterium]
MKKFFIVRLPENRQHNKTFHFFAFRQPENTHKKTERNKMFRFLFSGCLK